MVGCDTPRPPSGEREAGALPPPMLRMGRYTTDTLVMDDSSRQIHGLVFQADSSVSLEFQLIGGPLETRPGAYSVHGPNLTVEFPAQGTEAARSFRWRLIMGRLVPVDWDRTLYGPAGLTLHRR